MTVSSRDTFRLMEAGRQIRMGLISEVRQRCSVSSGTGPVWHKSGRAGVGGGEGCLGSEFPPLHVAPSRHPGPFPLLAAELNHERQHTDLRRLEALQKHEVSPRE